MRENSPSRQATADMNGKLAVFQVNLGNAPAEAEPQQGYRRYLHP